MKTYSKNSWINKWNVGHSIFFSIVLILLYLFNFDYSPINLDLEIIICLFPILLIGMSHGALDNNKGERLLKNKYKSDWKKIFYISYISAAIIVIIFWLLFPQVTLILFLIVAAYHFGHEDCNFLLEKKNYLNNFLFILKGSIAIFSPLYFSFEETINLFQYLLVDENSNFILTLNKLYYSGSIKTLLTILTLSSLFFLISSKSYRVLLIIIESLGIIIVNYIFTPILAFTIYWCFLHSVRHALSLAYFLNKSNPIKGFKKYLIKALPLALLTILIYLSAIIFMNQYLGLISSSLKVIFIGAASLTFPHVLLEYLLEKNEKRA